MQKVKLLKAVRFQDADPKLGQKVEARADQSRQRSLEKVSAESREKRRKKSTIPKRRKKSARSSKMKWIKVAENDWFTKAEVEAATFEILQRRIISTWVILLQMKAIICSLLWVFEEILSNEQTQGLRYMAETSTTLLRQLLLELGKTSLRHTFKTLSLLKAASGSEIINKQKTRGRCNTSITSSTAIILTKLAIPMSILADILSQRAPPIQKVDTVITLTSRRSEISPMKAERRIYHSRVEPAS